MLEQARDDQRGEVTASRTESALVAPRATSSASRPGVRFQTVTVWPASTRVSEKMLTQPLREMEADGLLHREVYPEVPPRVEYSLAQHGRTLDDALGPLRRWDPSGSSARGAEKVEHQLADVRPRP